MNVIEFITGITRCVSLKKPSIVAGLQEKHGQVSYRLAFGEAIPNTREHGTKA